MNDVLRENLPTAALKIVLFSIVYLYIKQVIGLQHIAHTRSDIEQ